MIIYIKESHTRLLLIVNRKTFFQRNWSMELQKPTRRKPIKNSNFVFKLKSVMIVLLNVQLNESERLLSSTHRAWSGIWKAFITGMCSRFFFFLLCVSCIDSIINDRCRLLWMTFPLRVKSDAEKATGVLLRTRNSK